MSNAIAWDRSPLATAPITRAISLVGCTRSVMSSLTSPIESAHEPPTSPSEARTWMRPSRPTACRSRANSLAMRSLSATTSLNVSAALPARPLHSTGRRTEKSPCSSAVNATSSARASRVSPSAWRPLPLAPARVLRAGRGAGAAVSTAAEVDSGAGRSFMEKRGWEERRGWKRGGIRPGTFGRQTDGAIPPSLPHGRSRRGMTFIVPGPGFGPGRSGNGVRQGGGAGGANARGRAAPPWRPRVWRSRGTFTLAPARGPPVPGRAP